MQKSLVLILVPLVIALGCAKRPVLYPNQQYEQSGQETAERNVSECLALAENAGLETNQAAEAGKRTAGGAVVGTATGAAAGARRAPLPLAIVWGTCAGTLRGALGGRRRAPRRLPRHPLGGGRKSRRMARH